LNRVKAARDELIVTNREIFQSAIAEKVGVTPSGLNYYPRIRAYLQKHASDQFSTDLYKNQAEMIKRVTECIDELNSQNEIVTWKSVAKQFGRSVGCLKYYPEVRRIVSKSIEYSNGRKLYKNEPEVLERVRAAISELRRQGEAVSQRAVARLVGMSQTGLCYYPQVHKLLNESSSFVNDLE
jgi:predicted transcriptional regulator